MLARLGQVGYWASLLMAALLAVAGSIWPVVEAYTYFRYEPMHAPIKLLPDETNSQGKKVRVFEAEGKRYELSHPDRTISNDDVQKAADEILLGGNPIVRHFDAASLWSILAGLVAAFVIYLVGRAWRYVLAGY
jgi:hypothetical protein